MTYIESQYEDGYIHSEAELRDVSPYIEGKNVFNDILERRPVNDHGKMVRFTLFHENKRYDVNWSTLPDNARPIRFKHMKMVRNLASGEETISIEGVDFGYQFTTPEGENFQKIINL